MDNIQTEINEYLNYCEAQKRLDIKTLKAYKIDLNQFSSKYNSYTITEITTKLLEEYIGNLHKLYKPKTVKRKIASLKAFFHHLEYREKIDKNPFNKLQVRFREPVILPKTIPLNTVEMFLSTIYKEHKKARTDYKRKNALRDIAVAEVLFSTGIRISELCSLKDSDVNLNDGILLIYGKGAKERRIQISNYDVINILKEYRNTFLDEIKQCKHFFANQNGNSLSDQAIRRMINKYTDAASIEQHITPHMFRHTFATSLLEADVDIRYIQEMLGHSSINITEIYTHVAIAKQGDILAAKHPRKNFKL
ncbi:MAG: tyrosine-type recombinase/integrase [Lachnospiraceae bacterium]|nr:tyrosine-type recombinase/integrase [Lachnospiraceae bacterium]